jgi:hypothetical protein
MSSYMPYMSYMSYPHDMIQCKLITPKQLVRRNFI